MSNARVIIVPLLFTIALIGLAIPKLLSQSSESGGEARQERSVAVRSMRVEETVLAEKIILNGTLRGSESVSLRSEMVGRVEAIHFQEGRQVQKGELLVKINDDEIQAELASVEAELELAKLSFNRQKGLYDKGLVSTEIYDDAANRLKVLEAKKMLLVARLEKSEIKAPFDGHIGLRYISPGELIDPNVEIARLEKMHPLRVDFSIPETVLSRVEEGMSFEVTVVGVEEKFRGQIVAFNPGLDPVTRMITVRGEIPNEAGRLRPGNFARVEIELKKHENAVVIPSKALIRGLGTASVFLIKNGRATEVLVKTGIRQANEIQILEGLEPGDEVITEGVQSLREGMAVRIVESYNSGEIAQN